MDVLGIKGSCKWSNSNSFPGRNRFILAADAAPNDRLATERLERMEMDFPALWKSSLSRPSGAITVTLCPRLRNCSDNCSTCLLTPPGKSQEYGETMPIFMAIILQHGHILSLLPSDAP